MGSLIFRPMTSGDLEAIAANLCAGELMTMRDLHGDVTPSLYIGHSVLSSAVVHVGELDGRPVCIFGVVPVSIMDGVGFAWFMATEEILRHPGTLVRGIGRHVVRLHEQFPRLVGQIDARHTSTIRWMRMLGGVISEPKQGPGTMQFCDWVKDV